jgi:hypothetical protein
MVLCIKEQDPIARGYKQHCFVNSISKYVGIHYLVIFREFGKILYSFY